MLIAHGASLDTCTRQLLGHEPRSQAEFYDVLHSTPYLGQSWAPVLSRNCKCVLFSRPAIAACKKQTNGKQWSLEDPPILPFRHQSNNAYDWKILAD